MGNHHLGNILTIIRYVTFTNIKVSKAMLKKGDKLLVFVLKFVGAIKRIFKFSVKFDNLLSTLNGDGMFLDPRMNGKKVLFHFC